MIYDQVKNLAAYAGLGENFAKAAAFLKETDLSGLPLGKTEVAGSDVFVAVSEYDPLPKEEKSYESHDRYADIQIVLSGSERIGYMPREKAGASKGYQADNDLTFYEEGTDPGIYLPLNDEMCAILLPEDVHKPGCLPGSGKVRKAVVKVRL
jgi:biofilm protein TabA